MPYPINPETGRAVRGFAAMSAEKRKIVASRGGSSVPAAKRSFHVNRKLARSAGSKGGSTSRGGGRPKHDRAHPVTIG